MNKNLKRGLLALFSLFFVAGNAAATQYFASKLGYQELLGSFLFTFHEKPVYFPFDFWIWFFKYYNDAPKLFAAGFSIIAASSAVGVGIMMAVRRNTWKRPLSSCGTATWATREEIKEAKLLDGEGIFLGKTEDGFYLRDNDDRHAMVISPTRGGKGTGLVTPTGLSWKESALFIDIKGEIYGLTAGYRKEVLGQTVIRFDPSNEEGSAYFNPLDEIRLETESEIKDVVNIVKAISRPDGGDEADHWKDLAGSIIEGVVMHLKYVQGGMASFTDVLDFVFGEIPIKERLREMAETVHAQTESQKAFFVNHYHVEDGIHPFVKKKAYTFLQKEDKEFAGIISTVEEVLKDFFDPILAKNTNQSSFHIHDLMNAEKPVSLYLIVPPSDLGRLAKFFRLIVVLIYQRLTEKMDFEGGLPVKDYKHKLLLLLDEFPALGRISELEKALGYIAGYGLRAFIIIQGLNQLFAPKMYGKSTSIIDNCHIRVFHTPNDVETPKYVNEMMGKETIEVKNKSYNNDLFQFMGANSYNVQEKGRDLMTAAEISKMDGEDEIIFVAGKPPIKCKKIRYYKDQNFIKRGRNAPLTDSLYPVEKLNISKKVICDVLKEKDEEKAKQAREFAEIQRKLEEANKAAFMAKAKAKLEALDAKKQEDMIGNAIALEIASEAAINIANTENEDTKIDSISTCTEAQDGFNDTTQGNTFLAGHNCDFDDDLGF